MAGGRFDRRRAGGRFGRRRVPWRRECARETAEREDATAETGSDWVAAERRQKKRRSADRREFFDRSPVN